MDSLNHVIENVAFLPNLSPMEMVIIFVVLMLLFGAKKIPELARGVGKSLGEFKKAKSDFEKELSLGEEKRKTKEGKES